MEYTTDLIEILNYIDPSRLDYQEWCCVGMALKYEGYSVSEWDSWSRRDSKRYHDKECLKKWDTFTGSRGYRRYDCSICKRSGVDTASKRRGRS